MKDRHNEQKGGSKMEEKIKCPECEKELRIFPISYFEAMVECECGFKGIAH